MFGAVSASIVYAQFFWTWFCIESCCCVIDENSPLNRGCCSPNAVVSPEESDKSD
jgi:hypothetical protein